MNIFWTFVLLFAAFLGTFMFFVDPARKVSKWTKEAKENDDDSEMIIKGCAIILVLLFYVLYNFIIEPTAVIGAIINNLGNKAFAYLMFIIIMVEWTNFARMVLNYKGKTSKPGRLTTEDGETYEGEVEIDKVGNPIWRFIRRIFFSLPTFYLWYLLFLVLGASD